MVNFLEWCQSKLGILQAFSIWSRDASTLFKCRACERIDVPPALTGLIPDTKFAEQYT